jgi:hypothetical protein
LCEWNMINNGEWVMGKVGDLEFKRPVEGLSEDWPEIYCQVEVMGKRDPAIG